MICSAKTDIGMHRKVNQDTYVLKKYSEKTCLVVVCDGMGGVKGGEEASKLAANTFAETIDKFITPYIGNKEKGFSANDVKKAMKQALINANEAVYQRAKEDARLKGMGTTLVSAIIIDKSVFCLNVGDSRMYFMKGSKIKQITKDHSYIQHLLDLGRITPEDAEKSPHKNIITRAVGTEPTVDPDIYRANVTDNTFVLLCTDGLINFVDDATICDIVSNDYSSRQIDQVKLDIKVRKLIDTANNNGGADNITVSLVKI